jgi:hypothetical protein
MATTINSDDGIISGWSGYRSKSDNSGILELQSNGSTGIKLDTNLNVGIGTSANPSAILDIQSTTKGVRLPNMTTTQKDAISNPPVGLIVFDITLAKICVYSGIAWQTIN